MDSFSAKVPGRRLFFHKRFLPCDVIFYVSDQRFCRSMSRLLSVYDVVSTPTMLRAIGLEPFYGVSVSSNKENPTKNTIYVTQPSTFSGVDVLSSDDGKSITASYFMAMMNTTSLLVNDTHSAVNVSDVKADLTDVLDMELSFAMVSIVSLQQCFSCLAV